MKKVNKEKILEALELVQKATPDDSFLARMESMAVSYKKPELRISFFQILAVAASLALLVVANVALINQSVDSSSLSDAYNLIPAKSIYNG